MVLCILDLCLRFQNNGFSQNTKQGLCTFRKLSFRISLSLLTASPQKLFIISSQTFTPKFAGVTPSSLFPQGHRKIWHVSLRLGSHSPYRQSGLQVTLGIHLDCCESFETGKTRLRLFLRSLYLSCAIYRLALSLEKLEWDCRLEKLACFTGENA